MSATAEIRMGIMAAIANINGPVGGYTHDLSAPGQVKAGRFTVPPGRVLPFACVYGIAVRESTGGVPTNELGETGSWMITAWARGAGMTPEQRLALSDTLLDDLRQALRSSPGLGLSYVIGHTVDWVPTEGEVAEDWAGPDQRSFSIVIGIINVTWREARPGV